MSLWNWCPEAFGGAVISSGSDITNFLTNVSGASQLTSTYLTIGGTTIAVDASVTNTINGNGINGVESWTYTNEFTIQETSTSVVIAYAKNITISSAINYAGKSVTIMSYNGNIAIEAAITASNVTLIAKGGIVSIPSPSVITATNLTIFDNGLGSLTPNAFSSVTGRVVINVAIKGLAVNCSNTLTVTSLSVNGGTYTINSNELNASNTTSTSTSSNGSISIDTVNKILLLQYNGNVTLNCAVAMQNQGYALVIMAGCNITMGSDTSYNINTSSQTDGLRGGGITLISGGEVNMHDLLTAGGPGIFDGPPGSGGNVIITATGSVTLYYQDIQVNTSTNTAYGFLLGSGSGGTNPTGGSIIVTAGGNVGIEFGSMSLTDSIGYRGGVGLGAGWTGGNSTGGSITVIAGGNANISFGNMSLTSYAYASWGGIGLGAGTATGSATSGCILITANGNVSVNFGDMTASVGVGCSASLGLGGGWTRNGSGAGGSIAVITSGNVDIAFGAITVTLTNSGLTFYGGVGMGGGYSTQSSSPPGGSIIITAGGDANVAFGLMTRTYGTQSGIGLAGGGLGSNAATTAGLITICSAGTISTSLSNANTGGVSSTGTVGQNAGILTFVVVTCDDSGPLVTGKQTFAAVSNITSSFAQTPTPASLAAPFVVSQTGTTYTLYAISDHTATNSDITSDTTSDTTSDITSDTTIDTVQFSAVCDVKVCGSFNGFSIQVNFVDLKYQPKNDTSWTDFYQFDSTNCSVSEDGDRSCDNNFSGCDNTGNTIPSGQYKFQYTFSLENTGKAFDLQDLWFDGLDMTSSINLPVTLQQGETLDNIIGVTDNLISINTGENDLPTVMLNMNVSEA